MKKLPPITSPVQVYIDGSSRGNPGPGGYGVVFIDASKKIFEYGGRELHTTNNRMELQAVIEAFKIAEEYLNTCLHDRHMCLEFCSDSTYVVNGITQWLSGWKSKGWRTASKGQVLNQDLWKSIDAYVQKFGTVVRFSKVAGHAGVEHNERADTIATSFALQKDIALKQEFMFV